VNVSVSRKGGHKISMTHPSVTIQITPESAPSTPSWIGEVAAFVMFLRILFVFLSDNFSSGFLQAA